jgi:hypothetical protein
VRIFRTFLVFVAFVCVATATAAQEAGEAGQVSQIRGAPELIRGADRLAVVAGTPVLVGDILVTQARDRMEILLVDRSVIVIGPASRVRIARYDTDGDGARAAGVLEVVSGLLRAIATPGGDLDVRARTTVVSVRSTTFTVEAAADRNAVFVASGSVAVADPAIDGGVAVLTAGEGIDVRLDPGPGEAAVLGPQRWGVSRIADTIERTTIGR